MISRSLPCRQMFKSKRYSYGLINQLFGHEVCTQLRRLSTRRGALEVSSFDMASRNHAYPPRKSVVPPCSALVDRTKRAT